MRNTCSNQRLSRYPTAKLLAPVVLLGIVASLGFSPVLDWVAAARVDAAARVVQDDLRRAVALANRLDAPIRVEFEEVRLAYRFRDRRGAVLFERTLGPGTPWPVEALVASARAIVARPGGNLAPAVDVIIIEGAHSARVALSASGIVRVTPADTRSAERPR